MESQSETVNTHISSNDPSNSQVEFTEKGKPRTYSDVWNHMKREVHDNGTTNAICNYCKKKFTANTSSGTSHLSRHLGKCNMRKQKSMKNFHIVGSVSNSSAGNMSLKKHFLNLEEIREALCLFVIAGGHPFSIVEEPGFKYLMTAVAPDFSVVSRFTIKRDAIRHYKEEKKLVAMELQSAPGRICFTTDNWRNENTADEFMCVTAHWIDSAWKLQKRIIKFSALTPPFDGCSLADEILLCLGEWKIADKVFSFTLDNASYNDTMIASLKSHLLRKHTLLLDGEFVHMRCCCHIINLVVQAGLKTIDEVVVKIRKIIIHLRHSIPKSKKFYEIASTNFSLCSTKRLRLDTPTRWNSTFTMLDRFLYFQDAIDSFVSKDMELKVHRLTEEDWGKVAELHSFLHTFYDVTNEFSASKTPTANVYFHGVWRIHIALTTISKGPPCVLSSMVSLMLEKLQKYWAEYNLLLSCAAVLDPRLKLSAVEFCYSNLFGDVYAKEMVTKIKDILAELCEAYKPFASTSSTIEMAKTAPGGFRKPPSVPVASGPDLFEFLSKKRKTSNKSELDTYFDEDNMSAQEELDILKFWKERSVGSPCLVVVARDILTVPISSVPSESAFSLGKKMITPCKSSLASTTIEALACYEDWLRVKGFDSGPSKILKIGVEASEDAEDEEESVITAE